MENLHEHEQEQDDVTGGSVEEIWLIDRDSRERIYQLTRREVRALHAYKRGKADAVRTALCRCAE